METVACLAGCYPPSALKDNEGLTRLKQLARWRASYLASSVARVVQKLNFSAHKQRNKKGGRKSEGIYMYIGSRLDFYLSPKRPGKEEMRGTSGKREKQWLTGLTGERIFTKLDINCSALHLRQGTCKVS